MIRGVDTPYTVWNIFDKIISHKILYVQSFFTAFSDAVVSGILSALNTFVFMVAAELIMAYLFGENGLFAAQSVAETVTLFFSVFFMIHLRNKYGYGRLGKINC